MEQLQEGYVAAVAATAGCLLETVKRDVWGVDIQIVRPMGSLIQEQMIFAQLKNTTTFKPDPSKANFSYQFRARQHLEHLTKPRSRPKAILLVMVTRPDQSLWTSGDHDTLTVAHCCYWANLEGQSIKEGVQKPSVQVPTGNQFTAEALLAMFDRLDKGEPL
jgi:hypothetical protein